jgi:solute:Na+ symporter, SSS family
MAALGLVFNVLSDGAITVNQGVFIGAAVVLVYTLFGGMWSVAMTTFVQMIVIVLGLLYVTWLAGDMAGGFTNVISKARPKASCSSCRRWTGSTCSRGSRRC